MLNIQSAIIPPVMTHDQNPEAEAMLDREIQVLDRGFVRLVDYMGSDQRIVDAARVSYAGREVKHFRRNRELIRYLFRHHHTSPFEQVQLTFHVKLPIFVARQWIRHRTARVNELSGRYSVMNDEFYLPPDDCVRFQSKRNNQGASEEDVPLELRKAFVEKINDEQRALYESYNARVECGISRELARINLPLSIYTEWYWQIDLHNLFHFLKLRLDEHAQYEIRCYAEKMLEIVRAVAPIATESFEEYTLGAVTFSRTEFAAIKALLAGDRAGYDELAAKLDKLERDEFGWKLGE